MNFGQSLSQSSITLSICDYYILQVYDVATKSDQRCSRLTQEMTQFLGAPLQRFPRDSGIADTQGDEVRCFSNVS